MDKIATIEKLVNEIRSLEPRTLIQIQEEIGLLLSAIPATEVQLYQDLVPIDLPIVDLKDQESGDLQIQFHYEVGLMRALGSRTIQVTPAAQAALIQIFSASLAADEQAGRTPPKSTTLQ